MLTDFMKNLSLSANLVFKIIAEILVLKKK